MMQWAHFWRFFNNGVWKSRWSLVPLLHTLAKGSQQIPRRSLLTFMTDVKSNQAHPRQLPLLREGTESLILWLSYALPKVLCWDDGELACSLKCWERGSFFSEHPLLIHPTDKRRSQRTSGCLKRMIGSILSFWLVTLNVTLMLCV